MLITSVKRERNPIGPRAIREKRWLIYSARRMNTMVIHGSGDSSTQCTTE